MGGRRTGSLIGAAAGVLFVLLNAGGLPGGLTLQILGAVLFGLAGTAAYRGQHADSPTPSKDAVRVYWICVVSEVLAIPIGGRRPPRHRARGAGAGLGGPGRGHPLPALRAGLRGAPVRLARDGPARSGRRRPDRGPAPPTVVRRPAWVGVLAGFTLLGFSLLGSLTSVGQR